MIVNFVAPHADCLHRKNDDTPPVNGQCVRCEEQIFEGSSFCAASFGRPGISIACSISAPW